MTENIYLEVCKKTTAILGAIDIPFTSAERDLVECSAEEFQYLQMLDELLPDGWVTSLEDLTTYRKNKAEAAAKIATKPPTKPVAKSSASANTKPAPKSRDADKAKQSLISDIKKRNRK